MRNSMMRKQEGSALIFTLVILVAMLFGAIALFRSTDASSTVANNLSAKEVSVRAADVGIQSALTFISTMTDPEVAVANVYYPIQRKTIVDPVTSIPNGLVCDRQFDDATACSMAADTAWTGNATLNTVGNVKVWYVIDRLCKATPASDATLSCLQEQRYSQESHKVGEMTDNTTTASYYRVTVKTLGLSNTESYVQVVVPK
jgi:Tfp pilus assembly protein PilX